MKMNQWQNDNQQTSEKSGENPAQQSFIHHESDTHSLRPEVASVRLARVAKQAQKNRYFKSENSIFCIQKGLNYLAK